MLNLFFTKTKLSNGTKVHLLGDYYEIVYRPEEFVRAKVVMEGDKLYVFRSHSKNHRDTLFNWLKKFSKDFIIERTEILAEEYDFQYKKVAIRDQNTRWGSCSSRKNLNFNWRLIFAPMQVLDYVIIHELCHLKEMNHSKRFWDLVKLFDPNYKTSIKWLKDHGLGIKNIS